MMTSPRQVLEVLSVISILQSTGKDGQTRTSPLHKANSLLYHFCLIKVRRQWTGCDGTRGASHRRQSIYLIRGSPASGETFELRRSISFLARLEYFMRCHPKLLHPFPVAEFCNFHDRFVHSKTAYGHSPLAHRGPSTYCVPNPRFDASARTRSHPHSCS